MDKELGAIEVVERMRLRTEGKPEAAERICPICQGELEPEDEGPECDPTGCPARGDGEPIEDPE